MGYFFVAFFLPAIARRGPFLVRAFVCVRCPRTGRPRRWRVDHLPQPGHFGVGKVPHPDVRADARFRKQAAARGASDAEDVREGDLDALLARQIYASNTSHR